MRKEESIYSCLFWRAEKRKRTYLLRSRAALERKDLQKRGGFPAFSIWERYARRSSRIKKEYQIIGASSAYEQLIQWKEEAAKYLQEPVFCFFLHLPSTHAEFFQEIKNATPTNISSCPLFRNLAMPMPDKSPDFLPQI